MPKEQNYAVAYMVINKYGCHEVHITTLKAHGWDEFYKIVTDHINKIHSPADGYTHLRFIGREI